MTTIANLSHRQSYTLAEKDWQQTLLQLSPDTIFVLVEQRLAYANPAGLALLRATDMKQILGRSLDTLLIGDDRVHTARLHEKILGDGQEEPGTSIACKIARMDGTLANVEIRYTRFAVDRKPALQLSIRDISDLGNRQKNAAATASQTPLPASLIKTPATPARPPENTRVREALHHEKEILEMIALDKPLTDILEDVCDRMEGLLGSSAICSIMLLDQSGTHLHLAAAPNLPEEFCHSIARIKVGPMADPCGTAIHHNRAIIVEDVENDPLWNKHGKAALKSGLRACWSMPINTAFQQVLGAFAVYYPTRYRPSDEELAVIQDAINLIALAIDKKKMEQSLEQSEERYRSVVSNLTEGIMVIAPGGRILTCNPSAMRILKIGDIGSAGRRHRYFKRIVNDDGTEQKLGDDPASVVFRSGQPILNLSIGVELRDRTVAWLLVNVLPIFDGEKTGINAVLISFTDTTEVRDTQRQLHYMASHDALTGLPNRHQLHHRLAQALQSARTGNRRVAVLFLDLDRFKNVNDTAGHAAGDHLLKDVASRLSSCIRASDMLARLGGDEFVIVAEAFDNAIHLKDLAERVLARIREPFHIDDNEYYLGTSIGISVFPHDGEDGATLLRCADSAMYYAKESGRNNYQFFTTELNVRAQHRYALEKNLRRALQEEEFLVYYQPKICLQTSRIVGAEALIRWQMPEMGLIPPNEFIPISEDLGLILPIGRWVLEQTCKQVQQWRQHLVPDLVVSVNISPRQFQDPGLPKFIQQVLTETGLPASALQLEITEGLLMGEADVLMPVFNAIKQLGVSISLDDFGMGFSSLSYLQRFPIDNLKIDRSFIRDIPENKDSVVLTRAIIAMANALGMSITAEGVEKAEQMFFLAEAGCQQMQGYYFSRPLPVNEFEKLLNTHASSIQ